MSVPSPETGRQAACDRETFRALACTVKVYFMEQTYWLKRQRSALAMADSADGAYTRLIHFELAGRYSIMAAQSVATAPADDARIGLVLPARIDPPARSERR